MERPSLSALMEIGKEKLMYISTTPILNMVNLECSAMHALDCEVFSRPGSEHKWVDDLEDKSNNYSCLKDIET